MPNVGAAEILVILVVALLVFGPQKLPEIGRQVGKALRELRRMQASLRDEVREVLEPVSPDPSPPRLSSRTPETDAGDDEAPPSTIDEAHSEAHDSAPQPLDTRGPEGNGRDAGGLDDHDSDQHGTPAG